MADNDFSRNYALNIEVSVDSKSLAELKNVQAATQASAQQVQQSQHDNVRYASGMTNDDEAVRIFEELNRISVGETNKQVSAQQSATSEMKNLSSNISKLSSDVQQILNELKGINQQRNSQILSGASNLAASDIAHSVSLEIMKAVNSAIGPIASNKKIRTSYMDSGEVGSSKLIQDTPIDSSKATSDIEATTGKRVSVVERPMDDRKFGRYDHAGTIEINSKKSRAVRGLTVDHESDHVVQESKGYTSNNLLFRANSKTSEIQRASAEYANEYITNTLALIRNALSGNTDSTRISEVVRAYNDAISGKSGVIVKNIEGFTNLIKKISGLRVAPETFISNIGQELSSMYNGEGTYLSSAAGMAGYHTDSKGIIRGQNGRQVSEKQLLDLRSIEGRKINPLDIYSHQMAYQIASSADTLRGVSLIGRKQFIKSAANEFGSMRDFGVSLMPVELLRQIDEARSRDGTSWKDVLMKIRESTGTTHRGEPLYTGEEVIRTGSTLQTRLKNPGNVLYNGRTPLEKIMFSIAGKNGLDMARLEPHSGRDFSKQDILNYLKQYIFAGTGTDENKFLMSAHEHAREGSVMTQLGENYSTLIGNVGTQLDMLFDSDILKLPNTFIGTNAMNSRLGDLAFYVRAIKRGVRTGNASYMRDGLQRLSIEQSPEVVNDEGQKMSLIDNVSEGHLIAEQTSQQELADIRDFEKKRIAYENAKKELHKIRRQIRSGDTSEKMISMSEALGAGLVTSDNFKIGNLSQLDDVEKMLDRAYASVQRQNPEIVMKEKADALRDALRKIIFMLHPNENANRVSDRQLEGEARALMDEIKSIPDSILRSARANNSFVPIAGAGVGVKANDLIEIRRAIKDYDVTRKMIGESKFKTSYMDSGEPDWDSIIQEFTNSMKQREKQLFRDSGMSVERWKKHRGEILKKDREYMDIFRAKKLAVAEKERQDGEKVKPEQPQQAQKEIQAQQAAQQTQELVLASSQDSTLGSSKDKAGSKASEDVKKWARAAAASKEAVKNVRQNAAAEKQRELETPTTYTRKVNGEEVERGLKFDKNEAAIIGSIYENASGAYNLVSGHLDSLSVQTQAKKDILKKIRKNSSYMDFVNSDGSIKDFAGPLFGSLSDDAQNRMIQLEGPMRRIIELSGNISGNAPKRVSSMQELLSKYLHRGDFGPERQLSSSDSLSNIFGSILQKSGAKDTTVDSEKMTELFNAMREFNTRSELIRRGVNNVGAVYPVKEIFQDEKSKATDAASRDIQEHRRDISSRVTNRVLWENNKTVEDGMKLLSDAGISLVPTGKTRYTRNQYKIISGESIENGDYASGASTGSKDRLEGVADYLLGKHPDMSLVPHRITYKDNLVNDSYNLGDLSKYTSGQIESMIKAAQSFGLRSNPNADLISVGYMKNGKRMSPEVTARDNRAIESAEEISVARGSEFGDKRFGRWLREHNLAIGNTGRSADISNISSNIAREFSENIRIIVERAINGGASSSTIEKIANDVSAIRSILSGSGLSGGKINGTSIGGKFKDSFMESTDNTANDADILAESEIYRRQLMQNERELSGSKETTTKRSVDYTTDEKRTEKAAFEADLASIGTKREKLSFIDERLSKLFSDAESAKDEDKNKIMQEYHKLRRKRIEIENGAGTKQDRIEYNTWKSEQNRHNKEFMASLSGKNISDISASVANEIKRLLNLDEMRSIGNYDKKAEIQRIVTKLKEFEQTQVLKSNKAAVDSSIRELKRRYTSEDNAFDATIKGMSGDTRAEKLRAEIDRLNQSLKELKTLKEDALSGGNERLAGFYSTLEFHRDTRKSVLEGKLNRSLLSKTNAEEVARNRAELDAQKFVRDTQKEHNRMISAHSKEGNQARNIFAKGIEYSAMATMVYSISREIKNAIDTMSKFEKQMLEVTRVMDPLYQAQERLSESAKRLADKYGVSIIEVAKGMTVFAQQGKNATQVIQLTEASLLAANTTTMNATQATEALTSAIRQFNLSDSDAKKVIDSWLEVESRTAIQAGTMADAIKISGTAARIAGLSFHEFNGILSAVGSATRETGSQLGTAFKFIISKMNTEGAINALQKIGVATHNQNGDLRDLMLRLSDVNEKWKYMTTEQRASLAITIAGTRRYNTFMTLMERWPEALDAIAMSEDSHGKAMRMNAMIMDTYEKRVQKAKASIESFYASMSKDTTRGFLGSIQKSIELLAKFGEKSSLVGSLTQIGMVTAGFGLFHRLGGSMGISTALEDIGITDRAHGSVNDYFSRERASVFGANPNTWFGRNFSVGNDISRRAYMDRLNSLAPMMQFNQLTGRNENYNAESDAIINRLTEKAFPHLRGKENTEAYVVAKDKMRAQFEREIIRQSEYTSALDESSLRMRGFGSRLKAVTEYLGRHAIALQGFGIALQSLSNAKIFEDKNSITGKSSFGEAIDFAGTAASSASTALLTGKLLKGVKGGGKIGWIVGGLLAAGKFIEILSSWKEKIYGSDRVSMQRLQKESDRLKTLNTSVSTYQRLRKRELNGEVLASDELNQKDSASEMIAMSSYGSIRNGHRGLGSGIDEKEVDRLAGLREEFVRDRNKQDEELSYKAMFSSDGAERIRTNLWRAQERQEKLSQELRDFDLSHTGKLSEGEMRNRADLFSRYTSAQEDVQKYQQELTKAMEPFLLLMEKSGKRLSDRIRRGDSTVENVVTSEKSKQMYSELLKAYNGNESAVRSMIARRLISSNFQRGQIENSESAINNYQKTGKLHMLRKVGDNGNKSTIILRTYDKYGTGFSDQKFEIERAGNASAYLEQISKITGIAKEALMYTGDLSDALFRYNLKEIEKFSEISRKIGDMISNSFKEQMDRVNSISKISTKYSFVSVDKQYKGFDKQLSDYKNASVEYAKGIGKFNEDIVSAIIENAKSKNPSEAISTAARISSKISGERNLLGVGYSAMSGLVVSSQKSSMASQIMDAIMNNKVKRGTDTDIDGMGQENSLRINEYLKESGLGFESVEALQSQLAGRSDEEIKKFLSERVLAAAEIYAKKDAESVSKALKNFEKSLDEAAEKLKNINGVLENSRRRNLAISISTNGSGGIIGDSDIISSYSSMAGKETPVDTIVNAQKEAIKVLDGFKKVLSASLNNEEDRRKKVYEDTEGKNDQASILRRKMADESVARAAQRMGDVETQIRINTEKISQLERLASEQKAILSSSYGEFKVFMRNLESQAIKSVDFKDVSFGIGSQQFDQIKIIDRQNSELNRKLSEFTSRLEFLNSKKVLTDEEKRQQTELKIKIGEIEARIGENGKVLESANESLLKIHAEAIKRTRQQQLEHFANVLSKSKDTGRTQKEIFNQDYRNTKDLFNSLAAYYGGMSQDQKDLVRQLGERMETLRDIGDLNGNPAFNKQYLLASAQDRAIVDQIMQRRESGETMKQIFSDAGMKELGRSNPLVSQLMDNLMQKEQNQRLVDVNNQMLGVQEQIRKLLEIIAVSEGNHALYKNVKLSEERATKRNETPPGFAAGTRDYGSLPIFQGAGAFDTGIGGQHEEKGLAIVHGKEKLMVANSTFTSSYPKTIKWLSRIITLGNMGALPPDGVRSVPGMPVTACSNGTIDVGSLTSSGLGVSGGRSQVVIKTDSSLLSSIKDLSKQLSSIKGEVSPIHREIAKQSAKNFSGFTSVVGTNLDGVQFAEHVKDYFMAGASDINSAKRLAAKDFGLNVPDKHEIVTGRSFDKSLTRFATNEFLNNNGNVQTRADAVRLLKEITPSLPGYKKVIAGQMYGALDRKAATDFHNGGIDLQEDAIASRAIKEFASDGKQVERQNHGSSKPVSPSLRRVVSDKISDAVSKISEKIPTKSKVSSARAAYDKARMARNSAKAEFLSATNERGVLEQQSLDLEAGKINPETRIERRLRQNAKGSKYLADTNRTKSAKLGAKIKAMQDTVAGSYTQMREAMAAQFGDERNMSKRTRREARILDAKIKAEEPHIKTIRSKLPKMIENQSAINSRQRILDYNAEVSQYKLDAYRTNPARDRHQRQEMNEKLLASRDRVASSRERLREAELNVESTRRKYYSEARRLVKARRIARVVPRAFSKLAKPFKEASGSAMKIKMLESAWNSGANTIGNISSGKYWEATESGLATIGSLHYAGALDKIPGGGKLGRVAPVAFYASGGLELIRGIKNRDADAIASGSGNIANALLYSRPVQNLLENTPRKSLFKQPSGFLGRNISTGKMMGWGMAADLAGTLIEKAGEHYNKPWLKRAGQVVGGTGEAASDIALTSSTMGLNKVISGGIEAGRMLFDDKYREDYGNRRAHVGGGFIALEQISKLVPGASGAFRALGFDVNDMLNEMNSHYENINTSRDRTEALHRNRSNIMGSLLRNDKLKYGANAKREDKMAATAAVFGALKQASKGTLAKGPDANQAAMEAYFRNEDASQMMARYDVSGKKSASVKAQAEMARLRAELSKLDDEDQSWGSNAFGIDWGGEERQKRRNEISRRMAQLEKAGSFDRKKQVENTRQAAQEHFDNLFGRKANVFGKGGILEGLRKKRRDAEVKREETALSHNQDALISARNAVFNDDKLTYSYSSLADMEHAAKMGDKKAQAELAKFNERASKDKRVTDVNSRIAANKKRIADLKGKKIDGGGEITSQDFDDLRQFENENIEIQTKKKDEEISRLKSQEKKLQDDIALMKKEGSSSDAIKKKEAELKRVQAQIGTVTSEKDKLSIGKRISDKLASGKLKDPRKIAAEAAEMEERRKAARAIYDDPNKIRELNAGKTVTVKIGGKEVTLDRKQVQAWRGISDDSIAAKRKEQKAAQDALENTVSEETVRQDLAKKKGVDASKISDKEVQEEVAKRKAEAEKKKKEAEAKEAERRKLASPRGAFDAAKKAFEDAQAAKSKNDKELAGFRSRKKELEGKEKLSDEEKAELADLNKKIESGERRGSVLSGTIASSRAKLDRSTMTLMANVRARKNYTSNDEDVANYRKLRDKNSRREALERKRLGDGTKDLKDNERGALSEDEWKELQEARKTRESDEKAAADAKAAVDAKTKQDEAVGSKLIKQREKDLLDGPNGRKLERDRRSLALGRLGLVRVKRNANGDLEAYRERKDETAPTADQRTEAIESEHTKADASSVQTPATQNVAQGTTSRAEAQTPKEMVDMSRDLGLLAQCMEKLLPIVNNILTVISQNNGGTQQVAQSSGTPAAGTKIPSSGA